jgi:lipopolysaccharide O-acetyltransferase
MSAVLDVRDVVLQHVEPGLRALGMEAHEVGDNVDLLEAGLIDSFGLLELISRIEEQFGVKLDFDDLDPDVLTMLGPFCAYVESELASVPALQPAVEAEVPRLPTPISTMPVERRRPAVRRAVGRAAVATYHLFVRARNKLFSLAVSGAFHSFGKSTVVQLPVRLKNQHRIVVGDGVFIAANSWLQVLDHDGESPALIIGDGTTVAGGCVLSAAVSIRVGRNVGLSRNVYVADHTHAYADSTGRPGDPGITHIEPVEIGDDAWIGENAFILPGVRVGRGAVVSANAVVAGDVPDFSVVAGQPARLVRRLAAS